MKIKIEVTSSELDEMMCDSVEEFEQQIRRQLDDAIVDDEGGTGDDWMTDYDLTITVV